ncbi:methyl-accepting chemotaxis protein [Acetivibrio cellulolyticus]|uniref:methyl-accepting chemotaxis protein n=1 Tax=Acetivibrio cellulolyticus TaxID=35830 RepID=UPI0001E2DE7A|nr:methyl-accepting chemotaxis protein [Acetivibrio cellulolyticus]
MMKWISDLSLRKKVYLILNLTVIIISVFFFGAIFAINSVQGQLESMLNNGGTAQSKILNADRDLYQAYTAVQAVMISKDSEKDIESNIAHFNENVKGAKERIADAKMVMEKSKEEWDGFKGESSELTAFELFEKVDTEIDEWIKISNTIMENKSMGEGWEESFQTARGHLDEVSLIVESAIETNKELNSGKETKAYVLLGIIFIVVFLIILLFVSAVINNISRPLSSVVTMIKEIEKGHLKTRLNLRRKDEIGQLANTMDHYADDLQKFIVVPINKMADGNFDFELNVKDNEDELSPALKKTVESIKGLVYEANTLTSAAIDGELQIRGRAENFNGLYKDIISGINKTLDAVIDPIKEASSVLGELEKGNLQASMNGNYKGEHAIIKDALNKTIHNLKIYIGEITQVLNQMSDGNLDVTINNDFKGDFVEIKNSLSHILSVFNGMLISMGDAAYQVSGGSKQIADSSQMLSQSTTEQASAVEELSSTMNVIAEQTKKNAINAKEASEVAMKVKEDAIDGNEQMKDMLKSMDEIASASTNISKIIKVIDDIAFQTNILALNAAVEAARAGQHGKGFAVVADEVRSLAGRSSQAAKETTGLIEGTVRKTENGMNIARDTAEALNKIVEGVTRAAALVGEIATSSNEQATGISQVNQGVVQISQVIQTNSATSEESAASSQELSSQADILNEMVNKFKVRKNIESKLGYESLDAEIIQHLDEASKKSKVNSKKKVLNNKKSISLGDADFGKY